MKTLAAVTVAGIATVGAVLWVLSDSPSTSESSPRPAQDARISGAQLYAENCAACHGAELQGQPDWQSPGPDGRLPAPPHDRTGHTWHHPDSLLFDYTKLGGAAVLARQGVAFDSGMPGFADSLSDRQINSILAFIRSTWPKRLQDAQAARTQADLDAKDS